MSVKATESESYIRDWLESHPEGHILVTTEVAQRMGIESSGLSNADLTMETERLVDGLIAADQSDTLWDYVPALSALSIAMVIYKLHQRVKIGELKPNQFKWMVAKACGEKATRVLALTVLLSVPVLNVITGLALIANTLSTSGILEVVNKNLKKLNDGISLSLEASQITRDFERAIFRENLFLETAMKRAKDKLELQKILFQDDAFRRAYEATVISFQNIFSEDGLSEPTDDNSLEYLNPDEFVPLPVQKEGVALHVDSKVKELQAERKQYLRVVGNILRKEDLRPHFYNALDEAVGREAAAKLARLIAAS